MFNKKISDLISLVLLWFLFFWFQVWVLVASQDPLDEELKNLLAMPNKIVTTTEEGDTIETFVYTGSENSAWTIKKKDGSILQFLKSTDSWGWTSYSFNDNGKTTIANIDKDGNASWDPGAIWNAMVVASNTTKQNDNKLTIITSEAVPWADCSCKDTVNQCTVVTTRKYECTANKWMLGFQEVFAKIIRYVINIVLLLGVLAVVGLGIAWSFAWGDDVKAKSTLKTWAINIVIWLLILFMFRYILLFLAPWIYR